MDYRDFFASKLNHIKQADRYRVFAHLQRLMGKAPQANFFAADTPHPAEVTVWCSNDYLGMGRHPVVMRAMTEAVQQYGVGAGGTRNIAGTSPLHAELETELADLHQKDAALLFGCGYLANSTTLNALGQTLPDCVIFSDAKNHASMIEGVRQSRCQKHIFQHNDLADLERLLQQYPKERAKIIAFESVYSMDGDIAPIGAICDLAAEYGALTYLDEVHAVGLYGPQGAGQAAAQAAQQAAAGRVDIIQGTLAKGFGVVGGYIASSAECVDYIRSVGAGFIFTTALPPAVVAAALTSVRYVRQRQELRLKLHTQVSVLKQQLLQAGLPLLPTPSHIVPFMVGDAAACKQLADRLLARHQIYVQPINYPTVPVGTERLRLVPSPDHTPAQISKLIYALSAEFSVAQRAAA